MYTAKWLLVLIGLSAMVFGAIVGCASMLPNMGPPGDNVVPEDRCERCLREIKVGMKDTEVASIVERYGFRPEGIMGTMFWHRSDYVHEEERKRIIVWTDSKSGVTGKSLEPVEKGYRFHRTDPQKE
jgi:hypothetical protein